MKPTLLVLAGILIGCAAAAVGTRSQADSAHAQATPVVLQYCTTTGDFNNIELVDDMVRKAGQAGWELIGVYRPAHLGATVQDYVCFRHVR
jgi:hypothetical protein